MQFADSPVCDEQPAAERRVTNGGMAGSADPSRGVRINIPDFRNETQSVRPEQMAALAHQQGYVWPSLKELYKKLSKGFENKTPKPVKLIEAAGISPQGELVVQPREFSPLGAPPDPIKPVTGTSLRRGSLQTHDFAPLKSTPDAWKRSATANLHLDPALPNQMDSPLANRAHTAVRAQHKNVFGTAEPAHAMPKPRPLAMQAPGLEGQVQVNATPPEIYENNDATLMAGSAIEWQAAAPPLRSMAPRGAGAATPQASLHAGEPHLRVSQAPTTHHSHMAYAAQAPLHSLAPKGARARLASELEDVESSSAKRQKLSRDLSDNHSKARVDEEDPIQCSGDLQILPIGKEEAFSEQAHVPLTMEISEPESSLNIGNLNAEVAVTGDKADSSIEREPSDSGPERATKSDADDRQPLRRSRRAAVNNTAGEPEPRPKRAVRVMPSRTAKVPDDNSNKVATDTEAAKGKRRSKRVAQESEANKGTSTNARGKENVATEPEKATAKRPVRAAATARRPRENTSKAKSTRASTATKTVKSEATKEPAASKKPSVSTRKSTTRVTTTSNSGATSDAPRNRTPASDTRPVRSSRRLAAQ